MVRAARSTSMPLRASSYSGRPSRLSAEYMGGTCCLDAAETAPAPLRRRGIERRNRLLLDHLPFGVAGVGARAELHGEFVAFGAGFDFRDDLGGFVEAQRQHAGGHGIERADVPGARGAVGLAHALQRAVRRQPLGLVEQDDAVRHGA